MNKIGIMGGTFNPIHFGHLFLAENAYEQAGLDKVLFMPSKNPPHKAVTSKVTEAQRVDMIELAIKDNPHFELSTLELNREGMTYTADTLQVLKEENEDAEYYFIVGTDSLFMMQNWKEPQVVFDLCTVLVAARDNANVDEIHKHMDFLKKTFQAKVLYIEMPMLQIASADIRERIEKKYTVRYYMPTSVIQYITDHRLYSPTQEVPLI